MYRVVAGLNDDPSEPGYKHVVIRPRPGPGFTFAKAILMTPYGEAVSGWRLDGDRLTVTARVPANSRGTVILPSTTLTAVREGTLPLSSARGVKNAAQSGDDVSVEIGSGTYEFVYDTPALAARIRRP
jgi:alpha-L-rhamnosidase